MASEDLLFNFDIIQYETSAREAKEVRYPSTERRATPPFTLSTAFENADVDDDSGGCRNGVALQTTIMTRQRARDWQGCNHVESHEVTARKLRNVRLRDDHEGTLPR